MSLHPENQSTDPSADDLRQSRRGFMKSAARLTILGTIGAVGGYLGARSLTADVCSVASICTHCAKLRSNCSKPQARRYRDAGKNDNERRG